MHSPYANTSAHLRSMILAAWNTSMVKDYNVTITSTVRFSPHWFVFEVLEAKSPTVRMTM